MDVDKPMQIYRNKTLLILIALVSTVSFGGDAFATGTKVELVDGKIVSKEYKPSKISFHKSCANANYTLKAQSFNNKSPVFYVKVRFGADKNLTTIYVGDEISSKLKESHIIDSADYGCLNDNGGLGIHIPSTNQEHSDLFLQISGEGRVFQNFDQTGYTITKTE